MVSDCLMQDMDGIQLLKYVQANDEGIPFILFTGRGKEEIHCPAFVRENLEILLPAAALPIHPCKKPRIWGLGVLIETFLSDSIRSCPKISTSRMLYKGIEFSTTSRVVQPTSSQGAGADGKNPSVPLLLSACAQSGC